VKGCPGCARENRTTRGLLPKAIPVKRHRGGGGGVGDENQGVETKRCGRPRLDTAHRHMVARPGGGEGGRSRKSAEMGGGMDPKNPRNKKKKKISTNLTGRWSKRGMTDEIETQKPCKQRKNSARVQLGENAILVGVGGGERGAGKEVNSQKTPQSKELTGL